MNKGIKRSIGKWALFLNSGDILFSEQTLANVPYYSNYDVLYGHVIVEYGNMYKRVIKARGPFDFIESMPFCHQALFTKTKLLVAFPYDIGFAIFADQYWFYTYRSKLRFDDLDAVISIVEHAGVSSSFSFGIVRERAKLLKLTGAQSRFLSLLLFSFKLLIQEIIPFGVLLRIVHWRQ